MDGATDLAVLGFAIDSSPLERADQALHKLPASAAAAERSTKSLTDAAKGLGAAADGAAAATTKAGTAAAATVKTYDVADAAYRRAMASMNAAATAQVAAMRSVQAAATAAAAAQEDAYAVARRSAEGYARAAQQSMVAANTARSREMMASVAASTESIKAMYVGATSAATTHAAAVTRVVASTAAAGQTIQKTAAMTAQQRLMLGYQLNDIFTQMSMGTNPLMVAAQQGPQITQIFGGIKATLAAIPKPLLVGGGAALGAGALVAVVSAIKDMNDALEAQKRHLGDALGEQRLAAQGYEEIRKSARAAGEAIEDSAAHYEKFAKASVFVGATTSQIGGISTIVSQLGKLGGSSPEEQNAATEALARTLKESTVSASNLDSILEQMPGLGRRIADGLGMSVVQLRLMTQAGDITNKQVFEGLLSQQAKVQADLKATGVTLGSFFGDVLQGAQDLVIGLYKIASGIELVSSKADAARKAQAANSNRPTPATPRVIGNSGSALSFDDQVLSGELGLADSSAINDAKRLTTQFLDLQRAVSGAANESVLAAAKIADKLDPETAAMKALAQQIDAVTKGLEALQSSNSGFDASKVVQETERQTKALQALREQYDAAGSAFLQAIKAQQDRQQQDELGMTPGQRTYAASVDRLRPPSAGVTVEQAQTVVDAQQLQMLDDMIQKQTRELDLQTAITQAMRGGKAAADEAAVAMQVLGIAFDQLGTITPELQVKLDVLAETLSQIRAQARAQSSIDASKPLLDQLAGIAAAMKAVEQGAYAMKRAEAEAIAARDENGTGKLQMQAFDARQVLTDETALSTMRQEIDLTNKLAAAAGDVARQKAIQLDFDIKRAQQSAGPGAREQISQTMRAEAAAKLNLDLAEGAVALEKQVELTKQQADIVRAGSADYAAQIAMLQKKNELLAKGVDLSNPDAQRQITASGDLARANVDLQRAQEAADQTKRIWQNAYDNIQNYGADTIFAGLKGQLPTVQSVADAMKNIFLRTFAELAAAAIIRPIIQPIFAAGQSLGIVPAGVGGTSGLGSGSVGMPSVGGGGLFSGMFSSGGGSIFGSQGIFGGAVPNAPGVMGPMQPGLLGPGGAASSFFNPASGLQMGSFGMGNLGGALGIGMGAMNLLNGGTKTTAGTIGGIGQMVGGALMMVPTPWTMAAGAVISLASSLLPGLLGGNEPPKVINKEYGQLAYGGTGFTTSGGAWGPDANAKNLEGPLKQAGTTIDALFQLMGGVKDAGKVWGVAVESYSKKDGKGWDFSNQTSYLVGPNGEKRQWGMGSTDQDIGLGTAAAQVALQSILGGATGEINANMRKALEKVAPTEGGVSLDTIKEVVVDITALDAAIKTFGKTSTNAEQALKAVDESFQALLDTANKYNLDTSPIDAAKAAERAKVGADFIAGIDRQFMDPTQAALFDIGEERTNLLRNNSAMVGVIKDYQDQALRIEELYGKKRLAILEDATAAANATAIAAANDMVSAMASSVDNIQSLIRDLSPGGPLANVDPRDQLAGLRATSAASYAQAIGNPTDSTLINRAVSDARAFAEYSLKYNAGDTNYVRDQQAVLAQQQALQVATVQQSGQQVADPELKQLLQQLLETTRQPANGNVQRDSDLTRLISLLLRDIADRKRAA